VQLLPQLNQILASGQVTNNGPFVQQFERELTARLGIPTIVFSSGMAALIAMLRAVDVADGYVICPSFTFPATPHAIVMAGATPLFADIDPITLTLQNDRVTALARPPVMAVLGVDPYGICWQPPAALEVPILIDAAPSFGSDIFNVYDLPTSRGAAQIFSFHATKPFSTMEGGALCSHDADLIARAKMIRNFGMDENGDCPVPGFNGKMTEICAAVGLRQLEGWHQRVAARMDNANRLREALTGIEGLGVQRPNWPHQPVWTYQPVFIEPEFGRSRLAVMAALLVRGIQTRAYYWPPCHKLTCYDRGESLPVTERLAEQVLALPVYDSMSPEEIDHIAKTFKEIHG
jgi:dTDP-4-amino-4,6-dideoxy-D-glucose transaminase